MKRIVCFLISKEYRIIPCYRKPTTSSSCWFPQLHLCDYNSKGVNQLSLLLHVPFHLHFCRNLPTGAQSLQQLIDSMNIFEDRFFVLNYNATHYACSLHSCWGKVYCLLFKIYTCISKSYISIDGMSRKLAGILNAVARIQCLLKALYLFSGIIDTQTLFYSRITVLYLKKTLMFSLRYGLHLKSTNSYPMCKML